MKKLRVNKPAHVFLGVLLSLFFISPAARSQETDHWETAIIPGRQCSYLVPGGPVDPSWTRTDFDDSGWASGTGGVG